MNKENKEKVKKSICPINDCCRPTHKESKYCILHASAEEKTEEEFKKALKEYVNKIKKEDSDYVFYGFIFVGKIDFIKDLGINTFKKTIFGEVTFEGGAVFRNATFEGETDFNGATFKGYAYFRMATFKGYANFRMATFKGHTNFRNTRFEGGVVFRNANFKRQTIFERAIFEGEAYFSDITFKGEASFERATFKGENYFMKATFEKHANFVRATFDEDMNFQIKSFNGGASFKEVSISPGRKLNLKVKNNKVNVSFEHAYLEDAYLDISLGTDVLIDFTDALIRNAKIKKDQIKNHILQEKKKEFSEAQQVYLLLKNNFHSIGRYEDESWAFKKEKDMERKNYCHFKSLHKWLWSCFLNAIYGYGERPFRVIVLAIVIIIIFASIFMNFGIDANPQLDTIPKYNILKELFMGIRYGDLLVRLKDISLEQIKNCLYFSTVTFTTLGLGDFRPIEGWSRIFVGAEAFIGALMMALFIYTFARRTGGR